MKTKTVTIVIRGEAGEVKKAVYSADGECIDGDAPAIAALMQEFQARVVITEGDDEEDLENADGGDVLEVDDDVDAEETPCAGDDGTTEATNAADE